MNDHDKPEPRLAVGPQGHPSTYRAIVNTGPDKVEMQTRPTPAPASGQVRIRVAACGICATDLVMISGWNRTGFGKVPGHEWAGVVDCLGPGGDQQLVGRHCVAENVLDDGGEVGFEHDGGYGHYLLTEADKVHPLPDDFPLDVAALIEPLAVSLRGEGRLQADCTRPVLILGDGPIGILTLMLLRHRGAEQVVLVGGRESRLALATDLGAWQTVNYHDLGNDLVGGITQATGCRFASIVEATGSAAAADATTQLAERCGRVLIIGDYEDAHAGFLWNRVLIDELELIGSNASAGAWPEAVCLAVERQLPLDRLITCRLPVDQFEQALELARNDRQQTKVVMEW